MNCHSVEAVALAEWLPDGHLNEYFCIYGCECDTAKNMKNIFCMPFIIVCVCAAAHVTSQIKTIPNGK